MKFTTTIINIIAVGLLSGCAGHQSQQSSSASMESQRNMAFSHSREITNPYFPLAYLKVDVLESQHERIERSAKPEMRKTLQVEGQSVEVFVVEDREFKDGELAEIALDYFAQADDGTVYYLGEDVDEYKNGKVVGHSGAWLVGKDTPVPGVLMPAHPRVGQKFQSENVPHVTREDDEVVSVNETVTVPAGTFENCVKIREHLSEGTTEFKFYAPGVGCVREVEPDAEFALKSHQAQR